jgi:hypothetical protein
MKNRTVKYVQCAGVLIGGRRVNGGDEVSEYG